MRLSQIAICLFISTLAAFAQGDSGSITGVVTDQDGAIVSGAQIQAKNLKTGTLYKTVSSATGDYTLEQLPAGTYELTCGMGSHGGNLVVQ